MITTLLVSIKDKAANRLTLDYGYGHSCLQCHRVRGFISFSQKQKRAKKKTKKDSGMAVFTVYFLQNAHSMQAGFA